MGLRSMFQMAAIGAAGEGCKAALSPFDYLIRLAPAEVELAA